MSIASAALALPLVMAEWLSTGSHARVICDERQQILWHNANFEVLLSHSDSFEVARNTFTLTNFKDQSNLTDFFKNSDSDDAVIWVNNKTGGSKLVLQCQRINTPVFPSAFGIRVADAANHLADEFRHFEIFFNLTKQEAIICRLILEGKTVQDIVESEGKSSDTVRFHIRNIYLKVGVSSREALFANLHHFLFS